ncbi:TLE family member 5 [Meleagris gallopavo]|uniref:TLE family member 5 n=1 Tax=Meleagris gallopavo TaxID=9103 RepID=UPI0012AB482C|nr:TLE family member 5 [Meleagris gallopavo]
MHLGFPKIGSGRLLSRTGSPSRPGWTLQDATRCPPARGSLTSFCLSSLKLECDKLASEKSEMQRHYVMYYEMSYGLNIEMHKQAEIVKRLNGICAQVLPYLSQEHQQQVLGAIERAKQVTAPELNSIIRQQLQAHQLSQLQALALPLTPLPVGLQR